MPVIQSQNHQQIDQLRKENSDLKARTASQQNSAAAQQEEIEKLRAQLQTTAKQSERNLTNEEQFRAEVDRATASRADLLAQLQNDEKLLAQTRSEVARLSTAHNADQASTVAQQIQINQLSDQLRIASANVAFERQLTAAYKDAHDLLAARQLHVVDVRDMEANGKTGNAFGRVFFAEGKSLTFYAFDLNGKPRSNPKQTFQVWGQQEGNSASLRSLGFMYLHDKTQRRWALKVDNPDLVKELNSVFVTVEPPGGGKQPTGRHLLYAYVGEANHP